MKTTQTTLSLEVYDGLKNAERLTAEEHANLEEDRYMFENACSGCDGLGHKVEYCPLNRYF